MQMWLHSAWPLTYTHIPTPVCIASLPGSCQLPGYSRCCRYTVAAAMPAQIAAHQAPLHMLHPANLPPAWHGCPWGVARQNPLDLRPLAATTAWLTATPRGGGGVPSIVALHAEWAWGRKEGARWHAPPSTELFNPSSLHMSDVWGRVRLEPLSEHLVCEGPRMRGWRCLLGTA